MENKKKIKSIIGNTIYLLILIPIVIVTIRISYQKIRYKNKIPDIFGWKIFMILDDNMTDELKDGDLVFTKNINAGNLKENDIIAFRNGVNTVTIHKITNVEEKIVDNKPVKNFTLNAKENETLDTKYITEDKVEGILKHKIVKVGKVLFFIQKTPVVIGISCIIISIGIAWFFIARDLDKKEAAKLQQEELRKQRTQDKLEEQQKEKHKDTLSV